MRKFLIKLLGGKIESIPAKTEDIIKQGRRVGNSTRLIDKYVQDLFTDGVVIISDHYGSHNSNKRLFSIFLDRLNREHGFIMDDLIVKGLSVRFSDKYIKKNSL